MRHAYPRLVRPYVEAAERLRLAGGVPFDAATCAVARNIAQNRR